MNKVKVYELLSFILLCTFSVTKDKLSELLFFLYYPFRKQGLVKYCLQYALVNANFFYPLQYSDREVTCTISITMIKLFA